MLEVIFLYYIVYLTTNLINHKRYVGVHKTNDLDDGYIGSGKLIKRAIKKYGVEYFSREILATYNSSEELFEAEKEFIIELSPEYNLHEGGRGGWEYINSMNSQMSHDQKRQRAIPGGVALRNKLNTDGAFKKRHSDYSSKGGRFGGLSTGSAIRLGKYPNPFLGKLHTEQTKKKIGEANSKKQSGMGNSGYGSFWVTDGKNSKKIYRGDSVPEGWKRGRVMKN